MRLRKCGSPVFVVVDNTAGNAMQVRGREIIHDADWNFFDATFDSFGEIAAQLDSITGYMSGENYTKIMSLLALKGQVVKPT